ncbi:PREDICTED: sugar transporter SWEET1 isoform X2 [Dinoponera quadriceps]|uniref:Sugar transporter SWEET1 n=1 Tax=Dinoponera quadriceps TaxID=609295 RepID=A0A6P3XQV3_DINQU|nr:PREDICTED: sugar transporter SWEET1 isoform X2 [Dinoponera quadriceps]
MISTEIKDILALSASICTVLQFLAGVLVCKKYIKNGTTGDSSVLAFVTCFMSCSLWLRYGTLIRDFFVVCVNFFGMLLQICYIIIFTLYSLKSGFQKDEALVTKQIGFLSCSLTILFFASPLVLLAHVIRAKNTESLPFPVIMASMVVSCQWFAYGCLIDDQFIQIPNFMGCVLSGFQLCLFLIYPNKQPDQAYFI